MSTDKAAATTRRINVLTPFTLTFWPSEEAKKNQRGAQMITMTKGFHDLPLDHPLFAQIDKYYGKRVETPQAALERVTAAQAEAKRIAEDTITANAAAAQALTRMAAHGEVAQVDADKFLKEINTPINQLRALGSVGLSEAGSDVNVPVNELQARVAAEHGLPAKPKATAFQAVPSGPPPSAQKP
jgi:hypothetical protein